MYADVYVGSWVNLESTWEHFAIISPPWQDFLWAEFNWSVVLNSG